MSGNKRRVRSFVFDNGQLHQFEWLEDALEHAGGQISEELLSVIDSQSTVLIADARGDLPDEFVELTARTPDAHKRAYAALGMALLQTYSVRHPVLVIDVGAQFLMVVTPAARMEAFLKKRYRKSIPLKTPPVDRMTRWVVTIAADETLVRHALGLGPRPGVGRA